jgi:S-DNA-T family DNA segregation ATPase FtsK/SpoIIIE
VADPGDALRFGGRFDTSTYPPGRAVRVGDRRDVQVGHPGALADAVAEVAAGIEPPTNPPLDVGSLDPVIGMRAVPARAQIGAGGIEVTFARDHDRLAPCGLTLHAGEHALVLGPPRSGRTNTLAVIGRLLGRHALVVGSTPGALAELLGVSTVDPSALAGAVGAEPIVFLVDDADRVEDPVGLLGAAVAGPTAASLIVSISAERLRARFGHWTTELRTCRSGVIIRPGPLDGDLLGVALPPRLDLPVLPGRGLVVSDGVARVAQVARFGD